MLQNSVVQYALYVHISHILRSESLLSTRESLISSSDSAVEGIMYGKVDMRKKEGIYKYGLSKHSENWKEVGNGARFEMELNRSMQRVSFNQ